MASSALMLLGLFVACQNIESLKDYNWTHSWKQPNPHEYKETATPVQKDYNITQYYSTDHESHDNERQQPGSRQTDRNQNINGNVSHTSSSHTHRTEINQNKQFSGSKQNHEPLKSEELSSSNQGDEDAMIGGETVTSAKFPPLQWHVAAHCFWSDITDALPPSRFAVATGKLYRPWDDINDFYAQKSNVSAVYLPPRFRGAATSFQDDIAVVVLVTALVPSRGVRPLCVLFDEDLERAHLRAGNQGVVLGWGLTAENGPPAQALQYLAMPYVPIEECVAEAQPDFLKYITSDKICAGVTTGKALCQGDSGGGLVFFDTSTERVPFLFGVASTAPRNSNLCNAHARAALTRVLAHRTFLRAHVPDIEETCRNNYRTYSIETNSDLSDRAFDTTESRKPPPKFICNCYCNNSTRH